MNYMAMPTKECTVLTPIQEAELKKYMFSKAAFKLIAEQVNFYFQITSILINNTINCRFCLPQFYFIGSTVLCFPRANIGPSGVRALPLAVGINEGGHYFRYFGPSGVRALPLAAGINEGGHYFRYFDPSEVRATSGATQVGHYFR